MALRRGVGLVLILIGAAVLISLVGMVSIYVLATRGPSVAADSTLMLRVDGELAEIEPSGVIGQFLVTPPTVRSIVDNLRKAKVDDRISGVVLMPAGPAALWGKVQEIRDAVLDFKESGKPIIAYLEFGSERDYYLATACDAVYLMPTSPLDLSGLATYEVFLRGTLDMIGVYPDLLHIGEYKTAKNTFTEQTFTPAHREMTEALNRDLYDQLVQDIAESRVKTEAEVRSLLERGPFLPEDAVRLGLVDGLAYVDQIDDQASLDRIERVIDGDEYRGVSAGTFGLDRGPRIAVIYALGLITTGESDFDAPDGAVVGSDSLVRHIQDARDDESIRAIVLRVDSPGGSAIASDVIWRELMLTRQEKPIIASLSDVAASGGYYIAMPAHAIVAHPGTLTGSIGVVMGKFVVEGTLQTLGINLESVASGPTADIHSPVRPYSALEREKVEAQMQAIYDSFVEKAAQSRGMARQRMDEVARGRVWTGRAAQDVGLVDELGGLDRALALAKQHAGLDEDAEVELVVYPPPRTFYELLTNPLAAVRWSPAAVLAGPHTARSLGVLTAPLRLFRRGEPLAIMPYVAFR